MKDDGGSAFPNDGAWANGNPEGGMTLRDWFAGQALSAMLANVEALKVLSVEAKRRGDSDGFGVTAEMAYRHADAMLEERKK